jgi:hypothetical protein
LVEPLAQAKARRMYCLTAYPVRGRDHYSHDYCEWFAKRGGILCHLTDGRLSRREHWIGVGVDTEIVKPRTGSRRTALFDFPRSSSRDAAALFNTEALWAARKRLPGCRFVGTGPADSPLREAFDEWIPYGLPHADYVERTFRGVLAVVVGWNESMGLAIAEAQVAGAAVVFVPPEMKSWMLCPSAAIEYDRADPASLADALEEARSRDHLSIAAEAAEKFDYAKVVERVRAAIGV